MTVSIINLIGKKAIMIDTYGLYKKQITTVNDDYSVVIYDRSVFITQGTSVYHTLNRKKGNYDRHLWPVL